MGKPSACGPIWQSLMAPKMPFGRREDLVEMGMNGWERRRLDGAHWAGGQG